uniref:Uncharacterized protein n=1 Tax=Setaria viridis TaxID=4556 RepID=A0A4U6UYG7_SETVI|nr:hypothetical protein SEVIR_4G086401v2 [Setaria viridis]
MRPAGRGGAPVAGAAEHPATSSSSPSRAAVPVRPGVRGPRAAPRGVQPGGGRRPAGAASACGPGGAAARRAGAAPREPAAAARQCGEAEQSRGGRARGGAVRGGAGGSDGGASGRHSFLFCFF